MSIVNSLTSIRARITFWHVVVLLVTILASMLLNLSFLRKKLTFELEHRLDDDIKVVESHLIATGHPRQDNDHYEDFLGNDGLKRWIEVRGEDGKIIFKNYPGTSLFPIKEFSYSGLHEQTSPKMKQMASQQLLVEQEILNISGQLMTIFVARSTDRLEQEIQHLLFVQLLAFPFVIVLASVGGYIISGKMLSPLTRMAAMSKTISAEKLTERLPVENPHDELGQLSLAFNELLSKLDLSFSQMRQFTADASHELRTPLTAIRAVGETALRHEWKKQLCSETISSVLEEADKMSAIINELLTLARFDEETIQPHLQILDLAEIAEAETDMQTVLAEEKHQQLIVEKSEPCLVEIDRNKFRHAVSNILHNAIKYSPQGSTIRVRVGKEKSFCFMDILDQGPGIKTEHQERIFDRFYRIDKVRSRKTGSTGLGLAIAKRVVEIHFGSILLLEKDGPGCCFRILLPEVKAII